MMTQKKNQNNEMVGMYEVVLSLQEISAELKRIRICLEK